VREPHRALGQVRHAGRLGRLHRQRHVHQSRPRARARTLYGAEAIVDPTLQGHGIGGKLYAARFELVERLGLLRIRGGARLRSYHRYARRMSAADYVVAVVHGRIDDQTLSFQLHEGFHVLAVIPHYLGEDPETLGYAALIEWLNLRLAEPHH
jgi:GNAT superfamily N-acetyltransferase